MGRSQISRRAARTQGFCRKTGTLRRLQEVLQRLSMSVGGRGSISRSEGIIEYLQPAIHQPTQETRAEGIKGGSDYKNLPNHQQTLSCTVEITLCLTIYTSISDLTGIVFQFFDSCTPVLWRHTVMRRCDHEVAVWTPGTAKRPWNINNSRIQNTYYMCLAAFCGPHFPLKKVSHPVLPKRI